MNKYSKYPKIVRMIILIGIIVQASSVLFQLSSVIFAADVAKPKIVTIAGLGVAGYSGDNGPASKSSLNEPTGISVDTVGNVYFAETKNHVIRKINNKTGLITTIAGCGKEGFSGDNKLAEKARLRKPQGVAVDAVGNVYIADTGNNRIRKVEAGTGKIVTIAGNGKAEFTGDGGQAKKAGVSSPRSMVLDPNGRLFIADYGNHRVRVVNIGAGTISTFVGSGATEGSFDTPNRGGDGGNCVNASLSSPSGLALDNKGNLYIIDPGHRRVRVVDGKTKKISTFAGNSFEIKGQGVDDHDGQLATKASFAMPVAIAVDQNGSVYIADSAVNAKEERCTGSRIRKINGKTRMIAAFAGNRKVGYGGDGGPALDAQLYAPGGVAVDKAGNVYIADTMNHRIRKVAVK